MTDKQVVVLSTGGTIASRYDPETGRTRVLSSGQDLIAAIPALHVVTGRAGRSYAGVTDPMRRDQRAQLPSITGAWSPGRAR
ncbi:asparaginase domain-containing protein [Salinisphaera aquimarina]|uniref:Asparaginase domain-containing protein n=1 Tax=Salinisphaera aquimarina TaxID=2094031 RepID=A0ABV7ELQ7_9GAMM